MAKTNCLELTFRMNEVAREMETWYQKVVGTNDMQLKIAYQKDIAKMETEFLAIKHFLELQEVSWGDADILQYSKITPLEILDRKKKI